MKHTLKTLLTLTALLGAAASAQTTEVIRVDVAESMPKFVFDEAPVFDDGMPAHGNEFITQGYIYPYGTLEEGNGVNKDGSPEFPEKVLGEWTCRGWFVGEGAHTESGAWVITTQLYNFGDELGDRTLVSEGYEIADVGVAIERAITGGTGDYGGARGEASQVFLGFNASEGVNLRFELTVVKPEQAASYDAYQAALTSLRSHTPTNATLEPFEQPTQVAENN